MRDLGIDEHVYPYSLNNKDKCSACTFRYTSRLVPGETILVSGFRYLLKKCFLKRSNVENMQVGVM